MKETDLMSTDLSQEKKGAPLDPTTEPGAADQPRQPGQQQQEGAREGDYRNVETSVGKRADFGNEYETGQEEEMGREEAKGERYDGPGKS